MHFGRTIKPLPSLNHHVRHLIRSASIAVGVVGVSLGLGILGYHTLGRLSWIDSLVNASMILGGMGPVDPISSVAGKLFASFYALFSGVILLVAVGVLFGPAFKRSMHSLHLDLFTNELTEKE
jgi:hypothetical protein